ncbi:MarR family winged helix-turn-helix transcriptional regulator [Methanobrevibacter sp.]
MSLEEFKQIDAKALPIGKLISIIAKNQTIFLNRHLDNLDINATQLHLLFEISHQSDINQEKIAKRCCINKGAVARSIKKLEEKELIIRKIDDSNRRQNKISLTAKGEKTLKESIDLLHQWEREIYSETVIEKELLQKVLKQMAVKTMEINLKGE